MKRGMKVALTLHGLNSSRHMCTDDEDILVHSVEFVGRPLPTLGVTTAVYFPI